MSNIQLIAIYCSQNECCSHLYLSQDISFSIKCIGCEFECCLQYWFHSFFERCLFPILTNGRANNLTGDFAHGMTTHAITDDKEVTTNFRISHHLTIVFIITTYSAFTE